MKKATLLIGMLLLLISINSCTPQATADQKDPQSCCGDDGDIPPLLPNGRDN